jgi:uncharacterized membrane protein YqjE
MADSSPSSPGLLKSVRELADNLVGSVQDRLALFSVEFQEEKFRLIRSFIWLGAAFFTAVLALAFVSLAVIYCFSGSARLYAVLAFAVVYTVAFILVALGARRNLSEPSRPFASTLQEVSRDRACILPEI